MYTCSMISEEIYKFLGTMSCIKRYMYARIESKVGKELRQVLKLTSSLFTYLGGRYRGSKVWKGPYPPTTHLPQRLQCAHTVLGY